MHPLLSFGIRAGLSHSIPTNPESKDPVMDTDYSLPDVSVQPNKPPGFDGYNYPFWKFRMETYIKSSDIRLWDVIERGDHTPLDDDGFAKGGVTRRKRLLYALSVRSLVTSRLSVPACRSRKAKIKGRPLYLLSG